MYLYLVIILKRWGGVGAEAVKEWWAINNNIFENVGPLGALFSCSKKKFGHVKPCPTPHPTCSATTA